MAGKRKTANAKRFKAPVKRWNRAKVVVRNPKADEAKAVRAAMVAQAQADKVWQQEMAGWVNELRHIQALIHRTCHQNSQTTCRSELCLLINRRLKSRAFRAIEKSRASGAKPGPKMKKAKRPRPMPRPVEPAPAYTEPAVAEVVAFDAAPGDAA